MVGRPRIRTDPIDGSRLSKEARAMNGDLDYLLASKVKGPACSVGKLIERGNGFEAV